jgi:putative endonuclease
MPRTYYVYVLASRSRTLYIGVTRDLVRRVRQHKARLVPGFTRQYFVHRLVYMETASTPRDAIAREKQLEGWTRRKKLALIEAANPDWADLAEAWLGPLYRDAPGSSPPRPAGRSARNDIRAALRSE